MKRVKITANELDQAETQALNIPMRFYFKVNNSKLDKPDVLELQINKITNRLIKTHKIQSDKVELFFGTVDDDFIYNRCRLRISFIRY